MKLTKEQERALTEFIEDRKEDIKEDIEDFGVLKQFLVK